MKTIMKETKKAVAVAREKIDELKLVPKDINCAQCATPLSVPEHTYDWKCARTDCKSYGLWTPNWAADCAQCKALRPKLEETLLTCTKCNTTTPVPFTNALKHAQEASEGAKKAAAKAADAAKKEYETQEGTKKVLALASEATKLEYEALKASPPSLTAGDCDDFLSASPASTGF